MNNIFFNQPDPLLSNLTTYKMPDNNIQNNQYLYQQMMDYAKNVNPHDWLGELDASTKKLNNDVINELANNSEYIALSTALQKAIQQELMAYVKPNLNVNQDVITNIKRQMQIIEQVKDNKENEQKENLSELNDYMKNYSHLTFDEYKTLKKGDNPPKQIKNVKTKKK